jgi:hypothetical protein
MQAMKRRTVADDIRDAYRESSMDRFMVTPCVADFSAPFRHSDPPEQVDCKGCGAPRDHGAEGKCDYCGRPT